MELMVFVLNLFVLGMACVLVALGFRSNNKTAMWTAVALLFVQVQLVVR